MRAGCLRHDEGECAYLESSRHELYFESHTLFVMLLNTGTFIQMLRFYIGFNAAATQYGTWITRVHPLIVGTCVLLFSGRSPLTRQLEELRERRKYITKFYLSL